MVDKILRERYEICQQLGRNAGRQTLLARDLHSQQLVVVKLLLFGGDCEWDNLKLFEREAQTLQSLEHRAIPRYLDYFDLNSPLAKGFALVQTYIEAKSLESYITTGRTFSESELKQIAFAILEILAYLHSRTPPVIHRDIKPSNILLGDRTGNNVGRVYLVDFGSVQTLAAREGGTITVVGTYGYMPPEQFGGRAVPASDLYSLGATLIYLATGQHPADLPQQQLMLQFEHLTNLSRELTSWLRWMTQPSLDQRLASATEALQALERPQQLAPLASQKPPGSKVLLDKDKDHLEIILPPKRFSYGIGCMLLFAIAYNSFLVFLANYIFNYPIALPAKLLLTLYSVPFWIWGLFFIWAMLCNFFGRTRLRIDRQQISKIDELFGFIPLNTCSFPRQYICNLKYFRQFFKPPQRSIFNRSSEIIICVSDGMLEFQQYRLGGNGLLSVPELDWLASELSNWLGIPISAIAKL